MNIYFRIGKAGDILLADNGNFVVYLKPDNSARSNFINHLFSTSGIAPEVPEYDEEGLVGYDFEGNNMDKRVYRHIFVENI